jgi:predicted cupin superfamily sugar epimerase
MRRTLNTEVLKGGVCQFELLPHPNPGYYALGQDLDDIEYPRIDWSSTQIYWLVSAGKLLMYSKNTAKNGGLFRPGQTMLLSEVTLKAQCPP